LVLFFKKEQKAFFLKKEAKTFIWFRFCDEHMTMRTLTVIEVAAGDVAAELQR
jgi:hypothetical protein